MKNRVLFTCHEGCDARVWKWCGPGIRHYAERNGAELVELPKCLDANPQWVLFDAFKASMEYSEDSEFVWVDSDLVISCPATDVWAEYGKSLHMCVKSGDYKDNLRLRMNIPRSVPHCCTGVVKWNRAEAEKLAKWYSENKHRFKKSDGDQELMGAAMHETGLITKFFHPKMHVAGAYPPPKTVFKHKGGRSKIRYIPRFLETNRRLGISHETKDCRRAILAGGGLGNQLFFYARYLYLQQQGIPAVLKFNASLKPPRSWGLQALGADKPLPHDSHVTDYYNSQQDVEQIPISLLHKLDAVSLGERAEHLRSTVAGKSVAFVRFFENRKNDLKKENVEFVISDDERAARELYGDDAVVIHTADIDPLEILVAASHAGTVVAQHYSTFGWWAMWMNEKRKDPSRYIYHPKASTHIPAMPVFKITDRLLQDGAVRAEPKVGRSHVQGVALAHLHCLKKAAENGVYPFLILEDDAEVTDAFSFAAPKKDCDFFLVGISCYFLTTHHGVTLHRHPIRRTVYGDYFDATGMMSTHAIVYNNAEGVRRMIDICEKSLASNTALDVQLQKELRQENETCYAALTPWFWQRGKNKSVTAHRRAPDAEGYLFLRPVRS